MKQGLLLMDMGSPDHPEEESIRRYLRRFLMDSRVMDLASPLRTFLVRAIILPRRSGRVTEAYRRIWTEQGAPLTVFAQRLAAAFPLARFGSAFGSPSIPIAVEELLNAGAEEIVLLPLFPQYAEATTGVCLDQAHKAIGNRVRIQSVSPFYRHPAYIQAIADSLKGVSEHVLFSYHALPLRQVKKMAHPDYCEQCAETTHCVAQLAGISPEKYSMAFQSQMGGGRWTMPSTEDLLQELPQKGIIDLTVVCPGFFFDNLETLDEIAHHGCERFFSAGGRSYRLIPCLNDSPEAIRCVTALFSAS